MLSLKRGIGYATTAFALAMGAAIISPTAALAIPGEPTCVGDDCRGLNPAKTNCLEGAETIAGRRAVVDGRDYGHLEMRYSPRCHSNWVRFTPWAGLRGWLDSGTGGEVFARPWIWRLGVANSLQGQANQTHFTVTGASYWTKMVSAEGKTCWSVALYYTERSSSGQGGRHSLGTYNADCIS